MQLIARQKEYEMSSKVVLAVLLLMFSPSLIADNVSKDKKLNELVNVMDMDSMIDSIYSQMESMMQNMATQMGVQPDEQAIFDEYYKQMTQIIKEDMSWAKMEPLVIDIYRRNFTEKELDDMLAFYKTETGKSLLAKMPVVMQESMHISQVLMQQSIPKIQAKAEQLGEALTEVRNTKK